MEKFPINLADLVPKESTFTLSTLPGRSFTLCRWSLRVRAWATEKYTSAGLQKIFELQDINAIGTLAWFMLKEKDQFKSFGDEGGFLDQIVSSQDQLNVILALLGAVGIGEPEMDAFKDSAKKLTGGNPEDPKSGTPEERTGERSSTP